MTPYFKDQLGCEGAQPAHIPADAVTDSDIASAKEHLSDVHNSEQMRSALSQLRPAVVRELAVRGLISADYAPQHPTPSPAQAAPLKSFAQLYERNREGIAEQHALIDAEDAAAEPAQAVDAVDEHMGRDEFWKIIKDIHAAVIKQLPHHPCPSVRSARASQCPAEIIVNIESLGDYLRDAEKRAALATRQPGGDGNADLLSLIAEPLRTLADAAIGPMGGVDNTQPLVNEIERAIMSASRQPQAQQGGGEDAARLDALESNPEWQIESVGKEEPGDPELWRITQGYGNDHKLVGHGDTLRGAIDAALATKEANHG